MKEIISPVIMNGSARKFRFNDVIGYKKIVELSRYGDLTYATVIYRRGNLAYLFHLFDDKVTFCKIGASDEDVTYEEFEKFCKIN